MARQPKRTPVRVQSRSAGETRRTFSPPSRRNRTGGKRLPPLTGLARELFTRVINGIAFENYGDCCAVDDLAGELGKTTGRLQPAVRKLVKAGYVTVEGEVFPMIYPTVAALRHQDPKLSVDQAKAILAKVRRG